MGCRVAPMFSLFLLPPRYLRRKLNERVISSSSLFFPFLLPFCFQSLPFSPSSIPPFRSVWFSHTLSALAGLPGFFFDGGFCVLVRASRANPRYKSPENFSVREKPPTRALDIERSPVSTGIARLGGWGSQLTFRGVFK